MFTGTVLTIAWVVTAALAVALLYWLLARPWHLFWGATDEELMEPLPGEDLLPEAGEGCLHGITIKAPVEDVWPWLAQIGQDKGGFYSYTWLENLVGCHMHNADHIVPAFQHLEVGDKVWLHPKAPPLPVLLVEPYRALVMGSNTDQPGIWGFCLKPLDGKTTRLLVYGEGKRKRGFWNWIGYYLLFEPAHFIMERKMLLTIKRLAEERAHPARTCRPDFGDEPQLHLPIF